MKHHKHINILSILTTLSAKPIPKTTDQHEPDCHKKTVYTKYVSTPKYSESAR